jgi:hypothetical protein
MLCRLSVIVTFLLLAGSLCLAPVADALTAREILKESAKNNLFDSFRMGVNVKTFKGDKLLSKHYMWIMGLATPEKTSVLVEFEEPKQAKGIRFLFLYPSQGSNSQDRKGFMYVPATGVTVGLGGKSSDLGGTGLKMEDFGEVIDSDEATAKILKEEKLGERDCYVIRVKPSNGNPELICWISKKKFLLVKSQQLGRNGKVVREVRALKFFITSTGKEWPRKEEVLVPKKRMRIIAEKVAGVHGIQIPSQLMDQKTFGAYQWRQ